LSQHFLLSPAARTLSLAGIMRMTDGAAFDAFKLVRFAANGGQPFCPVCGCVKAYTLAETPVRWKCSGCRRKFSVTSGTLFHSRKLSIRDYLAVIAPFLQRPQWRRGAAHGPRHEHQPEIGIRLVA
jgi:hypothetical protein